MKQGNIKKLIRNFIVFILLIFLTLWMILKDQSITEIINVLNAVLLSQIMQLFVQNVQKKKIE